MTNTLTGVGCVLSCSHEPVNAELFGGEEHGHSYEVVVWFDNPFGPRDFRVCQAAVETLRKTLDHKKLPPELSTGEAIAAYFGVLNNVVEVEVRRPLERIYARWTAIAAATGTAKTAQRAECEASQSGPKGIAQKDAA